MKYRMQTCDTDGSGPKEHRVYDMQIPEGGAWWNAITDVPCPIEGCGQRLVWYEAGYVPGYRVCVRPTAPGEYDSRTIRHHFAALSHAPLGFTALALVRRR